MDVGLGIWGGGLDTCLKTPPVGRTTCTSCMTVSSAVWELHLCICQNSLFFFPLTVSTQQFLTPTNMYLQRWLCKVGAGVDAGDSDPEHSHGAHIPVHECHSVSWGVIRTLRQRCLGEWLVAVLETEHVFQGIVEWLPTLQHHGWHHG